MDERLPGVVVEDGFDVQVARRDMAQYSGPELGVPIAEQLSLIGVVLKRKWGVIGDTNVHRKVEGEGLGEFPFEGIFVAKPGGWKRLGQIYDEIHVPEGPRLKEGSVGVTEEDLGVVRHHRGGPVE
jgi:hypothetical protein